MINEQEPSAVEEQEIASLLLAAGLRPRPADGTAAEVRRVVEAEWRQTVEARKRRRRVTLTAMAASITLAAVGVWFALSIQMPAPTELAALTRTMGRVEYRSAGGEWASVTAGKTIEAPGEIRLADDARSALRLTSGLELRLDAGTQVAFADAHAASLKHGAVYVDAGTGPGRETREFVIDTPQGDVRHVGTQYEVRIDGDAVQVAVREGLVSISARDASYTGAAGEQLTLSDAGLERGALAPYAQEWAWVAQVSPPFDIEGRSVEAFLDWAERETGRRVRYASPGARDAARETRLRGSIEGLGPDAAVTAVLSTTTLSPVIQGNEIHIRLND